MNRNDDSALAGAGRVLGLWILFGALMAAILRRQITATVEPSFLALLFLGMSALLVPIYGGVLYFGARRRELPCRARGAGIATIAVFVVGLAFAGFMLWFVRALSGIH